MCGVEHAPYEREATPLFNNYTRAAQSHTQAYIPGFKKQDAGSIHYMSIKICYQINNIASTRALTRTKHVGALTRTALKEGLELKNQNLKNTNRKPLIPSINK